MAVNTPWQTQRLHPTEGKQTPRPRPPAFALRSRRPSEKSAMFPPAPPPPYREELDPSVISAARALGLDIVGVDGGEDELPADKAGAEVEKSLDAAESREGREEMRQRLRAMEKRLSEREKELSLAAQIGQSLLTTNISLRTQHENLLSSLPPPISDTVDRLSAPLSTARSQVRLEIPSSPSPLRRTLEADADLPDDLQQTLSRLHVGQDQESPDYANDTVRNLPPQRPTLQSFASSSSASSHSYARAQLQDLAEQNDTLLAKLHEVEEEEEARRRKMRKLESEIARLRRDLEKAEERREEEPIARGKVATMAVLQHDPPVRAVWRPRAPTGATEMSEEFAEVLPTLAYPQFRGTPGPLPILRRTRRQENILPNEVKTTPGPRLASDRVNAELGDASDLLNRVTQLRVSASPSKGHKSSMSTGSMPSSPSLSSLRGEGNRGMIESRRLVRKRVSRSNFEEPCLASPQNTYPLASAMCSSPSTIRNLTTPRRHRNRSTSPSDSPFNTVRMAEPSRLSSRSLKGRSLGSELGDDWGLNTSSDLSASDMDTSEDSSITTGIALSALLLALSPSKAFLADSSTPILSAGAFKDDSMDSSTFELLDQAVCERSMRWADDEKQAEDEMEELAACVSKAADGSPSRIKGNSWALTRFTPAVSTAERRLVKRARPVRDLPPPSRPYRAPVGLLSWGQPADPWESTIYPEDAGMPSPPQLQRPTRRTAQLTEDGRHSRSLSTRVKHSRSQLRAGLASMAVDTAPGIRAMSRTRSYLSLQGRVTRKAIEVMMDLWVFIQFVVVVGVFLWVTLRKGPRAILGSPPIEKRIA